MRAVFRGDADGTKAASSSIKLGGDSAPADISKAEKGERKSRTCE
jgi:hypothetical protein